MSDSHPSPVKIFILGNGTLLDEGVTHMLINHSQLSVTRISYTDDNTLYDLVNFEHPYAIFINDFYELDLGRVISLIFSVPSDFVKRVIVVHDKNSKLDVYDRPAAPIPVTSFRRKSVVVKTKEEFINLALTASAYA